MAIMYSRRGGCLGTTVKFGLWANSDTWASVKGVLERFMAYIFGGVDGSHFEQPSLLLVFEQLPVLPLPLCSVYYTVF